MHRKEGTHSNATYERKLRGRNDEMGRAKKIPTVHSWTDTPEESNLWTAWRLFPLDDDQICDFKDRVGDWVGVNYYITQSRQKSSEFQLELEPLL